MIWLDGILAVPGIGIKLDDNFAVAARLQDRIPAFIQDIGNKQKNVIIKQTDIWGFVIECEGFTFKITYKEISAKFSYFISEKAKAGGIPEFSYPDLKPFTEIFNDLFGYMEQILANTKDLDMRYHTVGIVADSSMDCDSLTPGLEELSEHIEKPWENGLFSLSARLCANLDKTDLYREQCFHVFEYSKEISQTEYHCLLDWQRRYTDPQQMVFESIIEELKECRDKAFCYYEKFGAGDLNYE